MLKLNSIKSTTNGLLWMELMMNKMGGNLVNLGCGFKWIKENIIMWTLISKSKLGFNTSLN